MVSHAVAWSQCFGYGFIVTGVHLRYAVQAASSAKYTGEFFVWSGQSGAKF